jgi:hypothetical protein
MEGIFLAIPFEMLADMDESGVSSERVLLSFQVLIVSRGLQVVLFPLRDRC